MIRYVYLGIVLLMGLLAYVRLAPSDPEKWHMMPEFDEDRVLAGGVMRVLHSDDPDYFTRLNQVIEADPSVSLLSGSLDEGMITYIARTKWIGFPDYVTVKRIDGGAKVFSRLRFGRSDLGVNGRRLNGWLVQVTP